VNTNTDNETTDQLENLYQDYWTFHASMIDKDHSPLAIAAILMTQSLSIYKTILEEDEYNSIVDSISDKRDKVIKLTSDMGVLH
jgi:hypothetical protein